MDRKYDEARDQSAGFSCFAGFSHALINRVGE
jgi:hypothetical protein